MVDQPQRDFKQKKRLCFLQTRNITTPFFSLHSFFSALDMTYSKPFELFIRLSSQLSTHQLQTELGIIRFCPHLKRKPIPEFVRGTKSAGGFVFVPVSYRLEFYIVRVDFR